MIEINKPSQMLYEAAKIQADEYTTVWIPYSCLGIVKNRFKVTSEIYEIAVKYLDDSCELDDLKFHLNNNHSILWLLFITNFAESEGN